MISLLINRNIVVFNLTKTEVNNIFMKNIRFIIKKIRPPTSFGVCFGYVKYPSRKIELMFDVETICVATARLIWDRYQEKLGISSYKFKREFGVNQPLYLIEIANIRKIVPEIDPLSENIEFKVSTVGYEFIRFEHSLTMQNLLQSREILALI